MRKSYSSGTLQKSGQVDWRAGRVGQVGSCVWDSRMSFFVWGNKLMKGRGQAFFKTFFGTFIFQSNFLLSISSLNVWYENMAAIIMLCSVQIDN